MMKEFYILKIIEEHVEIENAINQYKIADKYIKQVQEAITPRQVRKIIRELRESGEVILSTPHIPGGYYMAKDEESGLSWYKDIRRKAIKELVIARIVRDSCKRKFRQKKIEQLRIFEKVG